MIPFGLDINSAASTSAGFFNNAGITIGGDSGGLDATADLGSSASANKAGEPNRQLAGGLNPLNDPPLFNDVGTIQNDNLYLYIAGAVVGLLALAWFAFKK